MWVNALIGKGLGLRRGVFFGTFWRVLPRYCALKVAFCRGETVSAVAKEVGMDSSFLVNKKATGEGGENASGERRFVRFG
jgi:hypothetical protein